MPTPNGHPSEAALDNFTRVWVGLLHDLAITRATTEAEQCDADERDERSA